MSFECNASFVAYALLSTFATITEKERDAVRFIIELIPCYDGTTGKLQMNFDIHVLAQIYLAELRVMASRHGYIHGGSLEEAPQARALLNVIVMPLVRHLSDEEYDNLLGSLNEAYLLLARPLNVLEQLVIVWQTRNVGIRDWGSDPIDDLDYYAFGVELPGDLSIEDLLTPLPYPPNPSSTLTAEYTSKQSGVDLAEDGADVVDANETKAPPRSECVKELELKAKVKPNSNVFIIPFLGRSRGSSESRSEYSYSSGSSGVSWVFANEGDERLSNDEDMIRPRRFPSRESGQGAEGKRPRRERLARYGKVLFGHAQTGLKAESRGA